MIKKILLYSLFTLSLFITNNIYASNDLLYYSANNSDWTYLKNSSNSDNGILFDTGSIYSYFPSPDWKYIYFSYIYNLWNSWAQVYKKDISTGENTLVSNIDKLQGAIFVSPDWNYIYIQDWYGVIRKQNLNNINDVSIIRSSSSSSALRWISPDWTRLFLDEWWNNTKNFWYIDTTSGVYTFVTSVPNFFNGIYYNSWVYYTSFGININRQSDYNTNRFYKFENGVWTSLMSNVSSFTLSKDFSTLVYTNTSDWNKLYKKLLSDSSDWTVLTSNASYSPFFINFLYSWLWDSNWNYTHYILNRLTATEWNMQQVNNSAGSTSFSDYTHVKSNFLNNYSYMQSWYEAKWLTTDVINNNVDWNNWVTFSKTDVAWGMLDWYKLSAHYPFMSYKETDNNDNSIFWRTDLNNTSFQTDTTWTNVWVPAYPIRNGSGNIVAYLEFPCWNLICKDQFCSDIQKITNLTPLNPIPETHIWVDVLNPTAPYCWDTIKNTMNEECDWNDWIRHDQGETCNSQCKIETSPGIAPWCPTFSALWYICNPTAQLIFPIPSTPNPPGWNTNSTNTGSIINWTPPGSITLPVIWDINTNTGMTDTEKTISNDVVCSSIDEGFKNSKSIIVTNTMADTSFLTWLKWKTEFIKTLSWSSTEVAEKIIQKKLKAEKLNIKSSTYDLGTKWTVSWIQFNLSKIPNSAVMRKLVNLAIDHSSTTMADYEQTIKDSCNWTITSTWTMVVPAWFIDVNEKGETMLNLFRYNWN